MKKATVKFFGGTRDKHGIPQTIHNYFVVAFPGKTEGQALAVVDCLSFDAPLPKVKELEVEEGGTELALREMIGVLRQLPENENLQIDIESGH